MQIDILIDGEKKTFVTDIVPMRAKMRFLNVRKQEEALLEQGLITAEKQIEFTYELADILATTIYKEKFTVDQLIDGVTDDYFNNKLAEAIFGEMEEQKGNESGK